MRTRDLAQILPEDCSDNFWMELRPHRAKGLWWPPSGKDATEQESQRIAFIIGQRPIQRLVGKGSFASLVGKGGEY
jgi:hypothetical protein